MERKIKTVSTFAALGSCIVGALILYNILSWLIPLCFTDPERWGRGYAEPENVHPTQSARIAVFLIWFIYTLVVFYTISFAVRIGIAYRNGRYFDEYTYRLIFGFGAGIMVTVLSYFGVQYLHHLILQSTIDGPLYFSWRYLFLDSTLLAVFFCGAFFCVIGWVTNIATEIKRENEEII